MRHPTRTQLNLWSLCLIVLSVSQLCGCAGTKGTRLPGMGLFAKKDAAAASDMELDASYPPPSASVEAQSLAAKRHGAKEKLLAEKAPKKSDGKNPAAAALATSYPVTQTPNFQVAPNSPISSPARPMTIPSSTPTSLAQSTMPNTVGAYQQPGPTSQNMSQPGLYNTNPPHTASSNYTNSNGGMTIPPTSANSNTLTSIANQASQFQQNTQAQAATLAVNGGYSMTPPGTPIATTTLNQEPRGTYSPSPPPTSNNMPQPDNGTSIYASIPSVPIDTPWGGVSSSAASHEVASQTGSTISAQTGKSQVSSAGYVAPSSSFYQEQAAGYLEGQQPQSTQPWRPGSTSDFTGM